MKNLISYLETVVDGVRSKGPTLREALVKMDQAALDPETNLDPKLRHYLERRSYTKALDWVRTQSADQGCGS